MKILQAKEMDVIVIVGADSIEKAEYGVSGCVDASRQTVEIAYGISS
jgi:hypothetical protein